MKSVLMLLGPKARLLKMHVTIVIVAKFLVDNVDVFIVTMSHRTSVQVTLVFLMKIFEGVVVCFKLNCCGKKPMVS